MERYESQHKQIRRSAEQIYTVLSDFSNFTPILQQRVENWNADSDHCSFRFQGIDMQLRIIDRQPFSLIKIGSDEGSPLEFSFWLQFKEVAPYDTRMRVVVDVNLNFAMKMMLGSKIQKAVDQIAEQISVAFQ